MKIDILRQRENKVLNRREIDFRIDHVGGTTPSRADIRAKLAAQLDSDLSAVVIRRLKSRYGIGITEGIARIYPDSEHARSIEIGYVLKRHEPKKKEKAGEVAEKPTEGAEEKAAEKAEKKKPEKKPEKEAEKAEKRPEKGTEKPEKKPEKEAEKAEKKPEKKKRAEAADEEES